MDDPPPPTNALKRRQSDDAEEGQESKRQRISPGKNSPAGARDDAENNQVTKEGAESPAQEQPKVDTREARRKSSLADEKQRSKRLFGALLGSLNQPGDRTSKRRQEIESRRKAELQRQDDERVEDKLRRQEQLAERRKREQARVDEENVRDLQVEKRHEQLIDREWQMHIRHSNLLHAANFLQTTAEPKLVCGYPIICAEVCLLISCQYYRPWDLRADEEERIDAQIKDAQAQIDRELDGFEQKHQRNGPSEHRSDRASYLQPWRIPPANQCTAMHSPSQRRTKSPGQDRKMQRQSPPELTEEAGKKADVEVEDQAPAKSEDSKPAEVPDSEATNPDTNDNATHESKNGHSPVTGAGKAEDVDEQEQEEGDHVVEGDEDTVIY